MELTEAVKKFHEKHGVVPDEDGWYSRSPKTRAGFQ
jgi:hypothetical protein